MARIRSAGTWGAQSSIRPTCQSTSAESSHAEAIIARILSLNPAIYEDIQFGNPHVAPMLDRLLAQLQQLRAQLEQGDDAARAAFRQQLLLDNRDSMGAEVLADGNYTFERVGYLLADLTERNAISVHLPEDRADSLRALRCQQAA